MDVVKQGSLMRLDNIAMTWVDVWVVLDIAALCCFTTDKDDARMTFPPLMFRNCRRVVTSLQATLSTMSAGSTKEPKNYIFAIEFSPANDVHFFSCDRSAKQWLQWTKALASIPMLTKAHQLGKVDARVPDALLDAFLGTLARRDSTRRVSTTTSTPRSASSASSKVNSQRGVVHQLMGAVTPVRMSASPAPAAGADPVVVVVYPKTSHGSKSQSKSLPTSMPRVSFEKVRSPAPRRKSLSPQATVSVVVRPSTEKDTAANVVRTAREHVQNLSMRVVDDELDLATALDVHREKTHGVQELQKELDRLRVTAMRAKQRNRETKETSAAFVAEEAEELRQVLREEANVRVVELMAKWAQREERYLRDIAALGA